LFQKTLVVCKNPSQAFPSFMS